MKDNILVVTPLYKIINRSDLVQDSECIHTLIKYWTDEYNVDVLFNYINGFSKLKNIMLNDKMRKIAAGYNYKCDNVNVVISERQSIFLKQINGLKIDSILSKKIIQKYELNKEYKFAAIHLPSTSQYLIRNLKHIENKFAIIHQTDLQYLRKHEKKFKEYLEKNFNKVFCRSQAIYNELRKYNISNLESIIISSGVNTIALKEERKFESKKLKFLYVGKLIKRKNLDILIKTLSKFDQNLWGLEVIGVGQMENKYKKLVSKLNLTNNINFLGQLKHDDVLSKMEKCDVFCMPSINETLGLVYLEAMSKGCLTIGTKNEGIDGIIKDGENGFLIKPGEESLYECIQKIYSYNSEVKRNISQKAINTAIKYNEADISYNYLKSLLKGCQ